MSEIGATGFAVLGVVVLVVLVVPLEQTAEPAARAGLPPPRAARVAPPPRAAWPLALLDCRRRSSSARCFAAFSPRGRRSRRACAALRRALAWTLFVLGPLLGGFLLLGFAALGFFARLATSFARVCAWLFGVPRPRALFVLGALLGELPSLRLRGAWLLRGRSTSSRLRCSSAALAWRRSSSARCLAAAFSSRRRRRASPRDSRLRRRSAGLPTSISSRSTRDSGAVAAAAAAASASATRRFRGLGAFSFGCGLCFASRLFCGAASASARGGCCFGFEPGALCGLLASASSAPVRPAASASARARFGGCLLRLRRGRALGFLGFAVRLRLLRPRRAARLLRLRAVRARLRLCLGFAACGGLLRPRRGRARLLLPRLAGGRLPRLRARAAASASARARLLRPRPGRARLPRPRGVRVRPARPRARARSLLGRLGSRGAPLPRPRRVRAVARPLPRRRLAARACLGLAARARLRAGVARCALGLLCGLDACALGRLGLRLRVRPPRPRRSRDGRRVVEARATRARRRARRGAGAARSAGSCRSRSSAARRRTRSRAGTCTAR